MRDRLEEILQQLGDQIGESLQVDVHNTCSLTINEVLPLQFECDANQEWLLIVSTLGELPAGKFRETILRDALIANQKSFVEGTLGYSNKINHLIQFASLPLSEIDGEKLASFLLPFLEKAEKWRLKILHT